MNIEFHYYAIQYLATSAGLGAHEAGIIASASQLVDEILLPITLDLGHERYLIPATQNYRFWSDDIQRDIYLPFHFLPGDSATAAAQRKDGLTDPRTVTPDSALARTLLTQALRSGDLFRIGIALHTYADTWAHQNFSSGSGPVNSLDTSALLPPAGHLQAFGAPDDPGGCWDDPRLIPEKRTVINRVRFRAAAKMIYRFLRTWQRSSFADEDFVLDRLHEIWASERIANRIGNSAARESRLSDYVLALGVPPYDGSGWMTSLGLPEGTWGAEATDPFVSIASSFGSSARGIAGKIMPFLRSIVDIPGMEGSEAIAVDPLLFEGSELQRWAQAAQTHREVVTTLIQGKVSA